MVNVTGSTTGGPTVDATNAPPRYAKAAKLSGRTAVAGRVQLAARAGGRVVVLVWLTIQAARGAGKRASSAAHEASVSPAVQ